MAEVSLSREGYTSYLGVPQDLKVQQGDDVVLKCSASSSEEPSYFWYREVRTPRECAVSSLHFTSLFYFSLCSSSLSWLCSSILLIFPSSNMSVFLTLWLSRDTCFSSHVIFWSPPRKKSSVFKWPAGLGTALAENCSLPTYRGLIV